MTTAPILGACGGPRTQPADDLRAGPFDGHSTAESVSEGLDLDGKLAVVTGCTSGIGYETMRVLALRGAYVVGTGRDIGRTREACASVVGITSGLALELADFESVVACAEAIRALNTPVDILVCNAGMRGGDYALANGVERHFAVNHLGHFLLVNRLLDRLYLAWQGRVVVVGSRAAYRDAPADGIQFADLAMRDDWSVSRAYGHSKLANLLFSNALAARLRGTRITCNAVHPGVVATDILREESAALRFGFKMFTGIAGKSVAEGAATSVYVATHPALGSVSGRYFEDCNPVTIVGYPPATDEVQANRLWDVSEEMTKNYRVPLERPDWTDFSHGIRGGRQPDDQEAAH